MPLFRRLRATFKALTGPADDPRETRIGGLRRQQTVLANVRQALADLGLARARLEATIAEVRTKVPALQEQARQRLKAGQEDLARAALQHRQLAVATLAALEAQVRDVELEEQRLSLVEQRVAAQIDALFAKEEVVSARHRAAEAQVRFNESLTGVSRELANFSTERDQAEDVTERMMARASAIDQLVRMGALDAATGPRDDVVEGELALIDAARAIEGQLAELKRDPEMS